MEVYCVSTLPRSPLEEAFAGCTGETLPGAFLGKRSRIVQLQLLADDV
jgi:hypothetical protein